MKTPGRGWHFPHVIAHRGGGTLAPENTLAGMREALSRGHKAVEFDVMLAADSVPVLMHDPRFGRTVQGTGEVARTPSAELARMDAGSWLAPQFRGETVPLFQDIVRWLHHADIWMNIEIKPVPGFEAETGKVVGQATRAVWSELEASAGAAGRLPPVFSSFSSEALAAARHSAPEVGRAMLWKQIPADWEARLQALDCIAVHCSHVYLTPALAAAIKQAGYGLMCYTVNNTGRAHELRAWGVDAICTDRIDLFAPDFFANSGA